MSRILQTFYTYIIAVVSGGVLWLFHIPLPWILGPVIGLMVFKLVFNRKTISLLFARNIGFSLLGIQIGLTFTGQTFARVGPYFMPYAVFSFVLIATSLTCAYFIAKKTPIDLNTSMIGSAPGGLSAMMALSESQNGNTVLVTIFHTIRLLTVLFIIPFIATHWLYNPKGPVEASVETSIMSGSVWTIFVYIFTFVLGYRLQHRIPASLVILPMLVTGSLQAFDFSLFVLPDPFFIAAQITIGVHLGNSVSLRDVIKAGKFCLYYLVLSLVLIFISVIFGYLLSQWTDMDIITAVLSLAPGGLIEMAITANNTGGSPAIVSSLQMIRLLTIVLLLPPLFKWLLPRLN